MGVGLRSLLACDDADDEDDCDNDVEPDDVDCDVVED